MGADLAYNVEAGVCAVPLPTAMDLLAAEYGSSSSDSDQEMEKHKMGIAMKKEQLLTKAEPPTPLFAVQESFMTQTKGYVSRRKRASCNESVSTEENTTSMINRDLSQYLTRDAPMSSKRRSISNCLPKMCERLPREHSKPVMSLDWHCSNSTVLLSCSLDGTVKLWDISGWKCIATASAHSGAAVSCGQWVTYNTVVTGGYDSLVHLSDMETGKVVSSFHHKDFLSVVHVHPTDKHIVFSGDFGANIHSWDMRTGKTVKKYNGAGGKILDMTFLQSGQELVASSDIVRKNASSQALRVWEVGSAVVVSGQVYAEPYTCPSLQAHPYRHEFYAQSNANYIVIFSGRRPYKCNKRKRYETHRVDGNKVQFDVSPDGSLLCSASSEGQVVLYDCDTSTALKRVCVSDSSCCAVSWNPHTPSTIAVSDWSSNITVLK